MEYKPVLKSEKKIFRLLDSYFKPYGYSNPRFWRIFEENNEKNSISHLFNFQLSCFKNIYEDPTYPINADVCIFKGYTCFVKHKIIEEIISNYYNKLSDLNVSFNEYTIFLNFKRIVEIDDKKTFKYFEYDETQPHFLFDEIDELIFKITLQISNSVIPFTLSNSNFTYLDTLLNISFEECGDLLVENYGTVWLKKMIIAKLAKNPKFEAITEFAKSKFIEGTLIKDENDAKNWKVALSHFDEMYYTIKAL